MQIYAISYYGGSTVTSFLSILFYGIYSLLTQTKKNYFRSIKLAALWKSIMSPAKTTKQYWT